MISEVTFLIEHGETTDPVQTFLDTAVSGVAQINGGYQLIDYNVNVNVDKDSL